MIFKIFSAAFSLLFLTAANGFGQDLEKPDNVVRVATYNVALNRTSAGALSRELESGASKPAIGVAQVVQLVRPDVLLVNEIDYDEGKSVKLLAEKYFQQSQHGAQPVHFSYHYTGPVNTGIDSGHDLNNNQKKSEPNDAFGFGRFPGQYGMAIYSRFPIETEKVRTFQKFLWKDMPDAVLPKLPDSDKPYYSDDAISDFRLSSKSHWDVPFRIGDRKIHLLASHPTPPVFDGKEDRNGRRNHDEIRVWSDYVAGKADYLYDDKGKNGGLESDAQFVIAGDLNADPYDGDRFSGAIEQLLTNTRINSTFVPASDGGKFWAEKQGGRNDNHKGDPRHDTGDFNDRQVGNLRIDYVLPAKSLKVVDGGVFWPKEDQPGAAAAGHSDHRLVWIDIEFE